MILDSPTNYPPKFVNHDLSVQLDSTNAFEGPEKLLEIWFAPTQELISSANPQGLRSIDRATWESMLDIVKCKVLSTVSTSHMDAFLLSESSMFVFPHKLILKTCGTTTTLIGIPRILEIAAAAGLAPSSNFQPYRVFYSRKSFMFPEMQLHPHRSWDDEVEFLDSYFENGSSYLVGNSRSDHWHLYTTDPAYTHPNHHDDMYAEDSAEDETLEILMTDLDNKAASQFFTKRIPGAEHLLSDDLCGMSDVESSSSLDENDSDLDSKSSIKSSSSSSSSSSNPHDPGHDLGALVTHHARIDHIYPALNQATGQVVRQTIDSFGFAPCGYSCNALVGTDDKQDSGANYFTIHVTPEQGFSYASFESNIPAGKVGTTNVRVLENVVKIFRPGKFSLTLFEAKKKSVFVEHGQRRPSLLAKSSLFSLSAVALEGYKRTDRILYEFDGYDMLFMSFKSVA